MSKIKNIAINKLNQHKPVATFDEDRCKIVLDEGFREMVHGFNKETLNMGNKFKKKRSPYMR